MPRDTPRDRPAHRTGTGGSSPARWRERLRDPLVLFLLLGAGVFALDHWRGDGAEENRRIVVTGDEVERLRARWTAQWGRPPTGPELQASIEGAVDEEILYREARRLGLDRDDAIVRRRLAQKLTFALEEAADRTAPSADEVESYFARHAERYRRPARTTFDHVFLSADRRADPAADAVVLLAELGSGGDAGWQRLGDPFMLARTYAGRTDAAIAGLFGAAFADAVSTLPPGGWRGPVESTYGMHLVRVRERTPARPPRLDEVRDRVAADLREERRREQGRAAYRALRDGYDVRLPAEPADRRLAAPLGTRPTLPASALSDGADAERDALSGRQ